jgi:16S rRNA (uracil1498-N3)-methyltransferase
LHVLVLVGPEGGWTGREREAACHAGFEPWRLGPHVMRIETAAAAAAAILRHAAMPT